VLVPVGLDGKRFEGGSDTMNGWNDMMNGWNGGAGGVLMWLLVALVVVAIIVGVVLLVRGTGRGKR